MIYRHVVSDADPVPEQGMRRTNSGKAIPEKLGEALTKCTQHAEESLLCLSTACNHIFVQKKQLFCTHKHGCL